MALTKLATINQLQQMQEKQLIMTKQQLSKAAERARSPGRDKNSNWQGQKCNNQLAGSKKGHQQLMGMKESSQQQNSKINS